MGIHDVGEALLQGGRRAVLMKLKGSPEGDVFEKIAGDIDSDAVPPFQLDDPGHPHGTLRRVRIGPLEDLLRPFAACGVSYQNHLLGVVVLGVSAEGHLGVDEEEAVLLAVD